MIKSLLLAACLHVGIVEVLNTNVLLLRSEYIYQNLEVVLFPSW